MLAISPGHAGSGQESILGCCGSGCLGWRPFRAIHSPCALSGSGPVLGFSQFWISSWCELHPPGSTSGQVVDRTPHLCLFPPRLHSSRKCSKMEVAPLQYLFCLGNAKMALAGQTRPWGGAGAGAHSCLVVFACCNQSPSCAYTCRALQLLAKGFKVSMGSSC